MSDKVYIDVLLVQPLKPPELVKVEDELEPLQKLVGGDLEEYMPFGDDVALICNQEGKLRGETLNRGIYGKDGELLDVIAGNFFICYAPITSENFLSLSEEQVKEYTEKFKYPELFFRGEDGKIFGKKLMRVAPDLER